MMRDAIKMIETPIVTNQVEFHPLLNQDILLATAAETGIPLSSYCSIARGEIFKFPAFQDIGNVYNKSAAQVALRWILQKGVSINTMSTKRKNIEANFDLMDFTLSSVDMARIEELTQTNYRIVRKDLVPGAPDFDWAGYGLKALSLFARTPRNRKKSGPVEGPPVRGGFRWLVIAPD